MCGIFGFALRQPLDVKTAFKILEKLEKHKYPNEKNPVGGYGAGVAVLLDDGTIIIEKIGREGGSPASTLGKIVEPKMSEARILLGHVRWPSPEFLNNANLKETAQPYVVELDPKVTIVSVHNGKVENYLDLRQKLGAEHLFESERTQLIDSEVIPHYFEEVLNEVKDPNEALYAFSCLLRGSNAISMLQVEEEETYMHFIHKGKTRGLTIWTNPENELIFCSRKEPIMEELRDFITRRNFTGRFSIKNQEDVGLKLSFQVKF